MTVKPAAPAAAAAVVAVDDTPYTPVSHHPENPYDSLGVDMGHNEARTIAFFKVYLSGLEVNMTIREGATASVVDDTLSMVSYALMTAEQMGFTMTPRNQTVTPSPSTTAASNQVRPPSGSPLPTGKDSNPHAVIRVKVTGPADKLDVELYSANSSLKFRVFHGPPAMLKEMVMKSHPGVFTDEQFDWLFVSGTDRTLKQPWLVEWKPTPKDPKWRDIVSIVVTGFE